MTDPRDAGFTWVQSTEVAGYWSFKPKVDPLDVDAGRLDIEVCLEPMLGGTWLLAVYVDGQLVQPNKLALPQALDIPAGGPLLELRL